MAGVTEDAGAGQGAGAFDIGEGGQHQRRGAIRDRTGIGGRDRAAGAEGGRQMRDLLGAGAGGLLVAGDHLLAGAGVHGDRGDLGLESAAALGVERVRQRGERVLILRFAGELEGLGAILGKAAHEAAAAFFSPVVGILEPVEKHVVDHLSMTETGASRFSASSGR